MASSENTAITAESLVERFFSLLMIRRVILFLLVVTLPSFGLEAAKGSRDEECVDFKEPDDRAVKLNTSTVIDTEFILFIQRINPTSLDFGSYFASFQRKNPCT